MSHKTQNLGRAPFILAMFSSLAVVIFLFFSPVELSHAQTTENRSSSLKQFRFDLTVDENTPVGEAIGTVEATDPDGDSLYFALTGGHTDLFSVDSRSGQLRTKALLDYETKPEDDYWLHVSVRDGKGPDGNQDLVADDLGLVVIEVTDGDEPGTVTLNWQRPQVDVIQTAALTDPNGPTSAEAWQWSRSSNRIGTYNNINGATSDSYTPDVGDRGYYLRVTVNYTDGQGPNKSASFTFGNTVTGTAPATRSTLNFSEGTSTNRSIVENSPKGTNIGGPVSASGGIQLRYSLGSGGDAPSFTIQPWSGQLQTKADLDYESKSSYTVTVEVTGTSGRSDSIEVTINVINQLVEIHGPSRVKFSEGDFIYSPVVVENYKTEPVGATLTLTGTDARHFSVASSPGTGTHGRLTFNEEPDYEAPRDSGRNNVYNITINATAEINGSTHTKRLNVQITVTNYNEGPVITGPTAVQFTEQTTGAIARYTASDPERDPIRWSVQDTDDWTFFHISRSGVLTFKEPPDYENPAVDGNLYEVVILAQSGMNMATDGQRIRVTVVDGADPPLFDRGYSVPRTVPENAPPDTSVGDPVAATGGPGKSLSFTLRGTHAGYFTVDSATGQLKTRLPLNYEARNSYSVTVRASDGRLSTDAPVTIKVENIDEDGTVTFSTGNPRARIPLTARLTDPDGGVTGITWQWSSSTDQSAWSDIFGATSQSITPEDGEVNRYLRVTAFYKDGHGAGKTAHAELTNKVGTGPNRSPSRSASATAPTITVAENTPSGTEIGAPVTTTDPDGDALNYSLVGGYASTFGIVAATGQLKTRAALNYETKNSYTLSVRARDPSSSYVDIAVEVTVTDEDEPGNVSMAPSHPRAGAAVTANLNDPDGGRSNTSWQWRLADTATGTAQNISGATGRSYTPVVGDLNKFLGVTVTYDDKFGTGKTVQSDLSQVGAARAPRNSDGGNDNSGGGGGGNLNQPPGTGPNPVITQTVSVAFRSANYQVNEGAATQVTVRLSGAAPSSLQVPVRVSRGSAESGDYRVSGLSGGALNFARGSSSASFIITALQDDDADDETLNLGFGTLPSLVTAGSTTRAILTINDDEQEISISYGSANYQVNEGAATQVTVRLSGAAPSSLQVPVRVSRGSAERGDYRVSGLSGGALNFAGGSSSASFIISALQDDDADDETLNLGFGTLPSLVTAGSTTRAILTINDDEVPPPLQLNVYYRSARYAVGEGRSISVTVNLSAVSDRTLTVPITATGQTAEAGDYQLSGLTDGTLYFAPGDRTQSFAFTARQDDDVDDEQVSLSFGLLPENVVTGSRALATVTIEDDDFNPVIANSTNGPPVFTEGATTERRVAEQTTRGTPVGLPVTAVDPDGDALTFYLSGIDASQFSLDSNTGQLRVLGQLDLEIKQDHLLNLSVSDGRGGVDFIVVVVNLFDIREVSVASPSTQSVGLVTGESPFYLETPDGTAAVELPPGIGSLPFFVRVESAAVDCGGPWPAGSEQALVSIQFYDSLGNTVRDENLEYAAASLRFDAQVMGGVEAVHAAHEQGGIQVYKYRRQEGDWWPHTFTLDLDELDIVTLTVADLKGTICLVAVTHPIAPAQPPSLAVATPEPEAGQVPSWAPNPRGRTRASERAPADSSIPVVDVGGSDGPSGGEIGGGPMVVEAGMFGELPWWPRVFLVLGTVLLLGALAWQFSQSIREKRLSSKTFSGPRNSIWKDIFRA